MTSAQPRPSFRPQAVLFDCDGLLLETESRWTIAETVLLERHGGRYTPEFKKRLLGTARETTQRMLAEELGQPLENAEALGDELEEAFIEAMMLHGTEPMPGVVELLEALDGVVPIAVASNNGEGIVRAALDVVGLSHRFGAVVCAGGPYAGKPAPDVYLAAAAALGADPARSIALEDSVVGATAARAAGCFTLGIPSFPGSDLPAHALYASLSEVGLAELGLA
ncbi:MAG TPA: HAD family phosphatase [Gaiellales bacterium]